MAVGRRVGCPEPGKADVGGAAGRLGSGAPLGLLGAPLGLLIGMNKGGRVGRSDGSREGPLSTSTGGGDGAFNGIPVGTGVVGSVEGTGLGIPVGTAVG